MKTCHKCNTVKTPSEFNKDASTYDGMQSRCRDCGKTIGDTYVHSKDGVIARIYGRQRRSSKFRNHPMPSYSLNELRAWVKKQPNFLALFTKWENSDYNKWKTPSCDRLNDYKPYTLDNLRLVTWRENLDSIGFDKINGINNKSSKAVIQMTLDGCFIAEHHSTCHASRKTGLDQGGLSRCCNGKNETTGGYRWMFSLGIPIHNNSGDINDSSI